MNPCVLCGHADSEHHGRGCHGRAGLVGTCSCTYVEPVPLPADADAAAHRARSDWWDRQARAAWQLGLGSQRDLARWYPIMRFHHAARQAEIAHRRYAETLLHPRPTRPSRLVDGSPLPGPVTGEGPQPTMSMAHRLELASIA
jgi:hypothetical protein